jgi:hypothetical protein
MFLGSRLNSRWLLLRPALRLHDIGRIVESAYRPPRTSDSDVAAPISLRNFFNLSTCSHPAIGLQSSWASLGCFWVSCHESIIDCGFLVPFLFLVFRLYDYLIFGSSPVDIHFQRHGTGGDFNERPHLDRHEQTIYDRLPFFLLLDNPLFSALIDLALHPILCGTIVRKAWS